MKEEKSREERVEKIFRIEEKKNWVLAVSFFFFFFTEIFGLEIVFCVGMIGFDSRRSLLVCVYGGF